MIIKVATSLKEVIESWRLVYHQYVAASLIEVNPFSIFTFPEYLQRNAAVMIGKKNGTAICSASAVLDGKRGLPLDAYFKEELDELRRNNRKMVEIGLLASVYDKISPFYMVELLASIAKFGVYSNHHDYVIGVHPRRSKFFNQIFGLEPISNTRIYHRLQKAEVVLLYADGRHFETQSREATKIVYHEERPLNFENRFRFSDVAFKSYKAGDYFLNFIRKFSKSFLPPEVTPQTEYSKLRVL